MGYKRNKGDLLTDAQRRVFECLTYLREATPKQLIDEGEIAIGKAMLHRHLKYLHQLGLIERFGEPPKVYYRCKKAFERDALDSSILETPIGEEEIFNKYFAYMKNLELIEGPVAFKEWFIGKQLPNIKKNKSRKVSVQDQAMKSFLESVDAFLEMRKDLENAKAMDGKLFDGTARYQSIHRDHLIAAVYYQDFYSLPVYGKTKLGHYVQKAKVGDKFSKVYIDRIARTIADSVKQLTSHYEIRNLLWVPHSIKRPIGLVDELRRQLGHGFPEIKVMKAFPSEVVPQKSISDLSMRIENALASNHITTPRLQLESVQNVLIIDDAIGSNATIHGIATKLKEANGNMNIFAFAPVGSFKGFDIIQDI